MGIRIHKKIGYSLSLKEVETKICKTNLEWARDGELYMENKDKWKAMCEEILKRKDGGGSEFFLEGMYLRAVRDNDPKFDDDPSAMRIKNGNFYNFVTYQSEFGCNDTILFQPLTCNEDWSRYDDSIDYIEETIKGDLATSVVRHNHTLYPFTQLMRKNTDSYMGIEEYWESCYLDKPKHKDAVPTCTYSVMLLLKYMELVPEDRLADAIMLLRPTIYTYWS